MSKIEDAGRFIPNAAKHRRTPSALKEITSTSFRVKLSQLWPEPDWSARLKRGISIETVSLAAMTYRSLAPTPKTGFVFRISDEDWEAAYILAIDHLKVIFESFQTVDDVRDVAKSLAARLGFKEASVTALPLKKTIAYWAAGTGTSKRLRPVNYLSRFASCIAPHLAAFGWPADQRILQTTLAPVRTTEGKWLVCDVGARSYRIVKECQEGLPEAIGHIKSQLRITKQETTSRDTPAPVGAYYRGSNIQAAAEGRRGPPARETDQITTQHLLETFHLGGIQFGASIPEEERQTWLNGLYDALSDLAHVLAWPRAWIGFNKELAIAIGARGKGKALAHYENTLKVINLTRNGGAGNLAHEYWHALDNRLRRTLFTNENLLKDVHATSVAMHISARRHNPAPRQAAVVRLVDSAYWKSHGEPTAYGARARKMDGNQTWAHKNAYWYKPTEMVARAFEAFVEDALAAEERNSPVLVKESTLPCGCYPEGAERMLIASHIRSLATVLRTPAKS